MWTRAFNARGDQKQRMHEQSDINLSLLAFEEGLQMQIWTSSERLGKPLVWIELLLREAWWHISGGLKDVESIRRWTLHAIFKTNISERGAWKWRTWTSGTSSEHSRANFQEKMKVSIRRSKITVSEPKPRKRQKYLWLREPENEHSQARAWEMPNNISDTWFKWMHA